VIDRRPANEYRYRPTFSLRLALELSFATGARQAELSALDWSAFRPASCTVRLTLQVARDNVGRGDGLETLKERESRTALVMPEWWRYHEKGHVGR
jgi:hypothetical protein